MSGSSLIKEKARYLIAGDKSIVVEFGNKIDEEINKRVISFMKEIEKSKINNFVEEMVPTYRSLTINYNPLKISYANMKNSLLEIESCMEIDESDRTKVHEIPVAYGGKYGEDLDYVAKYNNLSVEEVIKIHSSKEYLIYMLGFTPGFPYLGGMDERIATPRLKTPRTKIPGGSVGIAASQTGIYPTDSPGGWQLIGRTPLKLYDTNKESPILLNAGDKIKFVPITEEEYKKISLELYGGEI